MENAKLKTKSLLLLILAATFSFATANADQITADHRPWVDSVRQASRTKSLDFQGMDPVANLLEPAVNVKLQEIAFDQVQVWADTILEGDYLADERVQVDALSLVYQGKDFVGYHITYSTRAFDTSECDTSKGSTDDCLAGRITEATFVSPDLGSWIRDENKFAEFKQKLSARHLK